ncbi:hypothetical protein Ais01nite_35040 [Asanoa ishikariensis]|nr:hypothetical protein Ais01nite_35040 [Asanoa ishikariensis]
MSIGKRSQDRACERAGASVIDALCRVRATLGNGDGVALGNIRSGCDAVATFLHPPQAWVLSLNANLARLVPWSVAVSTVR